MLHCYPSSSTARTPGGQSPTDGKLGLLLFSHSFKHELPEPAELQLPKAFPQGLPGGYFQRHFASVGHWVSSLKVAFKKKKKVCIGGGGRCLFKSHTPDRMLQWREHRPGGQRCVVMLLLLVLLLKCPGHGTIDTTEPAPALENLQFLAHYVTLAKSLCSFISLPVKCG